MTKTIEPIHRACCYLHGASTTEGRLPDIYRINIDLPGDESGLDNASPRGQPRSSWRGCSVHVRPSSLTRSERRQSHRVTAGNLAETNRGN